MSRGIIVTADIETNTYTIKIPGITQTFVAQCITTDALLAGTEVEIADINNKPPEILADYGALKLLPNTGEYTYLPQNHFKYATEMYDLKYALIKGFLFASRDNERWQNEYPLYRLGTVTYKADDDSYIKVLLQNGNKVITCSCEYMICDCGIFLVGDIVILLFKNQDWMNPVAVGFYTSPKNCCDCEIVDAVEWSVNNPNSIERNQSFDIDILDGCPPFTWSINQEVGTGFSLAKSVTGITTGEEEIRTNTLSASGTASGTVVVSIVDKCGTIISGSILCVAGQWIDIPCSEMAGPHTSYVIDTNEYPFVNFTLYREFENYYARVRYHFYAISAQTYLGCWNSGYDCEHDCIERYNGIYNKGSVQSSIPFDTALFEFPPWEYSGGEFPCICAGDYQGCMSTGTINNKDASCFAKKWVNY